MRLFAETNGSPERDLLLDERGRRADGAEATVRLDRIGLRRSPARARAPRGAARTRARTARSRASSATTCATSISSRSKKRCAR